MWLLRNVESFNIFVRFLDTIGFSVSCLKINYIRTTILISPKSGRKWITNLVVRLFLRRWFLKKMNEHLLGSLMLVLDRTWLLKLILTWVNIRERNNVRCRIFIFGICSIPSCSNLVSPRHHRGQLFVFVFQACAGPALHCRLPFVTWRRHGASTEARRRHGVDSW